MRFVSRIDRTRIDGWLARILIRCFCTRRGNNFPMSKRQGRCLNLELPKGVEIKKDTTADGKFHKYTVSAFYVSAHA